MRAWVWMLVGAVGLMTAGSSHAQGFGTNNSSVVNRMSGANRTGNIGPNAHISSPFRLQNLFPSLNPFANRNPVGRSNIPNPNSEDYMKMFGYKKLF